MGTPGAVDKGLAIGGPSEDPMLYAANFSAGTVDVFNGNRDDPHIGRICPPRLLLVVPR